MFAGVHKERDPNLIRLEQNVFNQLKEIGLENDKAVGYTEIKKISTSSLPSALSFEDSIKELLEMQKNLK